MKISEITKLVEAEVLTCPELVDKTEVLTAFGSDMMSDVLAFVQDQSLLITGLVNPQTVRTAEMMDVSAILLVRGKKPDATILDMAKSKNIILMTTQHKMYFACGILYDAGLGRK